MFDFHDEFHGFDTLASEALLDPASARPVYGAKRLFDVTLSLLLLLALAVAALGLLILNPVLNHGPLLHRQRRMGQGGRPFIAFKFRSMCPSTGPARGPYDLLEEDRISRLGRFLRKTRLDELPQIINVLRGEMSLIGPRPDLYDHARVYLETVPGYAQRHQVMPGISGFAQTEVGYVDGFDGIQRKVAADLYYMAHASLRFDLWITWRTVCVVAGRKGR